MSNETKAKLKILGIGIVIVAILSLIWFMFFFEPTSNDRLDTDSNNVSTGLQRTQGDIERVQGDISHSQGTVTDIEQGTQGLTDRVGKLEESNRAAQESITNAERTSGDIESSVDHSIERLNRSQEILDKYSK